MDVIQSATLQREIKTPNNPGAGSDWVYVMPSGLFGPGGVLVKSVQAAFATDTTANQQPVLVIDDGAAGGAIGSAGNHVVAESVGATAVQAISTTTNYTWAEGLVQSGLQGATTDVHAQSPLPLGDECFLLPGWRIGTHTIGLHSGSQWTGIVLYVCIIG